MEHLHGAEEMLKDFLTAATFTNLVEVVSHCCPEEHTCSL